ncbi:conserved exported hypothetical protein [Candidatus Terasakiella magnetica]|nr:conserved exported hypothetical protein [Candidatus Terasakiella magnetica]
MNAFRGMLLRTTRLAVGVAGGIAAMSGAVRAAEFDIEGVHASWVTQVTAGIGIRAQDPSCGLTGARDAGGGGSAGCGSSANTAQWGNGHTGNLNYNKWQPYTGYLKGTTELLLSGYDGYKFMGRGTASFDPAARFTQYAALEDAARKRIGHDAQMLDLWVSKDYDIAQKRGHVRLGNQVVNWGESVWAAGGINATNSMDLQKLAIPGTQLKEAVIPAPMISFAQAITPNINVEAYYQFYWNHAAFAPVGTYWSVSNNLGAGAKPIYLNANNANLAATPQTPGALAVNMGPDMEPSSQGQFGVNVHFKPAGTQVDLGFYFLNYHDKLPVLDNNVNGTVSAKYLENRQLYGVSANFPAGDWSIGSEVSYRPRDAVALTGCSASSNPMDLSSANTPTGINCHQWKEMQKFQTDVVGLLAMTPSEYPFIGRIGADSGSLTMEGTWIFYPGVNDNKLVSSSVNGQGVVQGYQAGYFPWLAKNSYTGSPITGSKGTAHSAGMTIDYNLTYDGSIIPGWQVTPGATFFWAMYGNTPNFQGNYLQGAKSLNVYVNFMQNPAVWQGGVNFSHFFGGGVLSQQLGDRDFLGAYVTRNF